MQPLEIAVREPDTVKSFEFLSEVALKSAAVADVRTIRVFQTAQLFDEALLNALFFERERLGSRILRIVGVRQYGHASILGLQFVREVRKISRLRHEFIMN